MFRRKVVEAKPNAAFDLAAVLNALHDELEKARRDDGHFKLGGAEVEISFTVSAGGSAEAGVQFAVLGVGGGASVRGQRDRDDVHTLTVNLTPRPAESEPVAPSVDSILRRQLPSGSMDAYAPFQMFDRTGAGGYYGITGSGPTMQVPISFDHARTVFDHIAATDPDTDGPTDSAE